MLPPKPEAVRVALIRIAGDLLGHGVGEAEANVAELVLAEVLNNIVEHAFAGRGDGLGEGQIAVSCATDALSISFEVIDNGLPLPEGALPDGQLPQAAGILGALPEGGFGWFLIHTLACDIGYARADDQNTLRFRIARSGGVFNA